MTSLAVDTPPPPSPSQAPPSYDSLSDHGTHIHTVRPYQFTNRTPDEELEPELIHQMSYNDSLYADSGEGLVDNNYSEASGGRPDDPPPPYSPGLRYIRAVSGFDNVFVTDAPPSYSSVFGQIREARVQSRSNWAFLRRLSEIILNTVGCTILLIVFMSVPLAILVLGSVYVSDCPLEPKIPIFLIIGGISGVLKNVFLIVENVLKRHSRTLSHHFKRQKKWIIFVWRAINLAFNLFMLVWIICGSYWIFSSYEAVHRNEGSNCNELLYKFSFSIVISSYILLILMCCCTSICAGICLRRKKNRRNEEEEGREREQEEHSDGESRSDDNIEGELENESTTRGVSVQETEIDLEDGYMNGHQFDQSGVPNDRNSVNISDDTDRILGSSDCSRQVEQLASGTHPPHPAAAGRQTLNNGGVLFQQFDCSPYPSRNQVTVRRVRSNNANLNTSSQDVVSYEADTDEDIEDGFELGHANSSNVIAARPPQVCRRSDRPVSLSHLESNSVDSIPAMRACALIRNRVHHSSHSSGLYVTQYSDGFPVTAV